MSLKVPAKPSDDTSRLNHFHSLVATASSPLHSLRHPPPLYHKSSSIDETSENHVPKLDDLMKLQLPFLKNSTNRIDDKDIVKHKKAIKQLSLAIKQSACYKQRSIRLSNISPHILHPPLHRQASSSQQPPHSPTSHTLFPQNRKLHSFSGHLHQLGGAERGGGQLPMTSLTHICESVVPQGKQSYRQLSNAVVNPFSLIDHSSEEELNLTQQQQASITQPSHLPERSLFSPRIPSFSLLNSDDAMQSQLPTSSVITAPTSSSHWQFKDCLQGKVEKYSMKARVLNRLAHLQKLDVSNNTNKLPSSKTNNLAAIQQPKRVLLNTNRLSFASLDLQFPSAFVTTTVGSPATNISNQHHLGSISSPSHQSAQMTASTNAAAASASRDPRMKQRKDEFEEGIQIKALCESISQPIMESIITELQTGGHEIVIQAGQNSSVNAYNLAFLLKKFFIFCSQKASEKLLPANANQPAAHKIPKGAVGRRASNQSKLLNASSVQVQDMDANFQNLVLSEHLLVRTRDIIQDILARSTIPATFTRRMLVSFDAYSKFFLPTNNIKRVGMHNITLLIERVIMSLIDNQLIDKSQLLDVDEDTPSKKLAVSSPTVIASPEILKRLSEFAVNLLNEHTDKLHQQVRDFNQLIEISNFDYFMFKTILFATMQQLRFDQQSIDIILEKLEAVRLLFFRDVKHNRNQLFFDNKANQTLFKSVIAKNKLIFDAVTDQNLDAFIRFIDTFLVGYRDFANIKKIIPIKAPTSKQFFTRLHSEIETIIPQDFLQRNTLLLDIRHQLSKMESCLIQPDQETMNFHAEIASINIPEVVERLIDSIEYKIVTGEIPEDIAEQDILVNSQFLTFFLEFTCANRASAFSYFDLETAYAYCKMNSHRAFTYWVQLLSEIVHSQHPQIKAHLFENYLSQFMRLQP